MQRSNLKPRCQKVEQPDTKTTELYFLTNHQPMPSTYILICFWDDYSRPFTSLDGWSLVAHLALPVRISSFPIGVGIRWHSANDISMDFSCLIGWSGKCTSTKSESDKEQGCERRKRLHSAGCRRMYDNVVGDKRRRWEALTSVNIWQVAYMCGPESIQK